MIIRKIEMINFRGFQNKTINFGDKPVVLISAANGIGKTTVIDAIEWCLSGDIGRLKNAFDSRSTNNSDRKMNSGGILKNRDVDEKEIVTVKLWLIDGDKELLICRKQEEDKLDPRLFNVTINGNSEEAKEFIIKYIGDSFYNFHFCDVQKSFNIQSKKRADLNDLFSEFITNYDNKKHIAENLEIFAEDVERYIEDNKKLKTPKETLDEDKKRLAKAREEAKQIVYPTFIFYPEENTEIANMNTETLIKQKKEIEDCGYIIAKKLLEQLVNNEKLKDQMLVLKKINSCWETNGENVQRAVQFGFYKNIDEITSLETILKKLKILNLSKDTIFKDVESVNNSKLADFKQFDFESYKIMIEDKKKNIHDLSVEINILSKNNELLKLLTSLCLKKQEVIKYRKEALEKDGIVRCPVCGSDTFSTVEDRLILKEADEYIKQNGEIVREKESEKILVQKEVESIYKKIIDHVTEVIEKEKKVLEEKINNLKFLKENTETYFDEVKKLHSLNQEIKVEELTKEKVKELIFFVNANILEEMKEKEVIDSYQKILSVLGYKYENETIKQTYEKIANLIVNSIDISNFSYDLLVSKLNAIGSVLNNQEISDLSKKIEKSNKTNKKIDEEIESLENLKKIAIQRANDIKDIVNTLSKNEYESVGPMLSKFYNKLSKFNCVNGIKVTQEKDGISLVDSKDKNIVNILSNGQISVFLLAHFFAGINARNTYEKMKIYFIDDLTAFMDDVNMLAFMDLLKYQLSSKATIEQLFFVTCDNRISKLLKYKLSGREIGICELLEKDLI